MRVLLLLSSVCAALAARASWLEPAQPLSATVDGNAQGARVELCRRPDGSADVFVSSPSPLAFVRLRYRADVSPGSRVFGGDWERTYGKTGWVPAAQAGALPWYFLVNDGAATHAMGVKVQPNAFAAWKISGDCIELVLDCRAGSDGVELGNRRLKACTIVAREGRAGETPFAAAKAFCRMMCERPRRLDRPVYGYNDWYCAYGRNTAAGFLEDAKAVLSLADGLENRPFAVADDGWQDEGSWRGENSRWGMAMDRFAARLKAMDVRPGLWYRPLKHFRDDPTRRVVSETIAGDIAKFRAWGFELLKIDFITHDWNHRWNLRGETPVVEDNLHWSDRSRTTAETVLGLYRTMREAAGDDVVIIGCNAIDHFAAGLFEVQRTGDDTSGCDWELTKLCGPNALGMRAHHHGTFYEQDGDCAGLSFAGAIDWAKNRQWIDLLSRSGGAFFVSWHRAFLDEQSKSALREAFARASKPRDAAVPLDWMAETSPRRWDCNGERLEYDWDASSRKPVAPVRFAVLGDLHYCNADDNGDSAEARAERLAADIAKKRIDFDFVVQVGDLVNCQTGSTPRVLSECDAEWVHALRHVKKLFPDKPFLFTPGNHDWYGGDSWQGGGPCIRKRYIPFMEKELGTPLNGQPFFTFRCRDAFFVFLNHLGMEKGLDIECARMLEKAVATADSDASIARVFMVSHPLLWNVDYFRFNENAALLPILMKAKKFDAYFGGHIHMNSLTARKNDYNTALRQVAVAGTWPPVKEGPARFHAVPTLQLNPPPSKRLFSGFPADVESYVVVESSREEVRLRFEAVGGGTLAEYAWSGPYEVREVKPSAPRFDNSLPAEVKRARLYYFPFFQDRFLGGAAAPQVKVNGRHVGELKRNCSFYHSNWGKFFIEIPQGVLKRENTVEISNPSGERFLVRDLALMAAGPDGREHFTAVYPKMLSFGDWRTFYMGFGLVHPGTGIMHSDIESNASEEMIETVMQHAPGVSIRLDFK
jgi:alpha-galactosidase